MDVSYIKRQNIKSQYRGRSLDVLSIADGIILCLYINADENRVQC